MFMNGSDVERLLQAIDESLRSDREFVERYISEHREELIEELRQKGFAEIPTSTGRKITIGEKIAA
jgi:hypothetical protein